MVGTADLQIKALLALYHTSLLCSSVHWFPSLLLTLGGWLVMVGLDGTWTGRVMKGLVWRYDYRIIKSADNLESFGCLGM